jgi:DNA primase
VQSSVRQQKLIYARAVYAMRHLDLYASPGCATPTNKAGDQLLLQQSARPMANSPAFSAPFSPKLSLGRVAGGAIQLGPAAPSLVVTEGLEDGLTLAQALGRSVWVSAGTTMLPRMSLPDVTRAVVIGADADAAGEAAANKAAHVFAATGRQVRIMRPASGFKDFNAELLDRSL